METAIAKKNPAGEIEIVSESAAIIQLIERAASNPNVDIDKMERILNMRREMQRDQAKAAFMSALADMQTELPAIQERGEIKIGSGKPQRYALWEDINDAIKPVLARHGFALSFKTGQSEAKISVTGILGHRLGHSEETTMLLPLDTSGSKNAVQAVGSSTSYGKRYTAAALLNLTSRGEDDDGKAAGLGPSITEDQVREINKLIAEIGAPLDKVLEHVGAESVAAMTAAQFEKASHALGQRKRERAAKGKPEAVT